MPSCPLPSLSRHTKSAPSLSLSLSAMHSPFASAPAPAPDPSAADNSQDFGLLLFARRPVRPSSRHTFTFCSLRVMVHADAPPLPSVRWTSLSIAFLFGPLPFADICSNGGRAGMTVDCCCFGFSEGDGDVEIPRGERREEEDECGVMMQRQSDRRFPFPISVLPFSFHS